MLIPSGPLSGLCRHKDSVNNLWLPLPCGEAGSGKLLSTQLNLWGPPEKVGGSYQYCMKS